MTDAMLYRTAHAATAIASMAVFATVFFGLPARGALLVGMFCLVGLAATLWVGARTHRSTMAAMASVRPRPRRL